MLFTTSSIGESALTNWVKKKAQTPPYSRSGLRQPIITYVEVCAYCAHSNVIILARLSVVEVAVRLGIEQSKVLYHPFRQSHMIGRQYFAKVRKDFD